MNKFFDEQEEFVDESDFSELLAELPMPLVKENLKGQIKDPVSTRANNLEYIQYRFNAISEIIKDDTEMRFEFTEFKKRFYLFLLELITEEYDIAVDYDEDNVNEIEEKATALYEVLVLRYIKNMEDFYYKYVLRNKTLLIDTYGDIENYKDMSATTVKKILESVAEKPELILIAQLPSIFKDISSLAEELTNEEFITTSGMDRLENGFRMLTWFESGQMIGNFIGPYMGKFFGQYDDLKQEIFNEVRIKLIMKYGTRN